MTIKMNSCIITFRKGDITKGFAEADFIIERKFKTQFIEHSYIEPEAVLAEPSEQGGIKITGCVQNLFSTRRSVASMLNLDLAQVQIVQSTLGGSFGGKDEAMTSDQLPGCITCNENRQAGKNG